MTVVLDTNVVISGLFFGGVPGDILLECVHGSFCLVASPEILDEYREVTIRILRKTSPTRAI